LIDLLQAAVTALKPNATYLLALGPLRHVVVGPSGQKEQRYLVIVPAEVGGKPKSVQNPRLYGSKEGIKPFDHCRMGEYRVAQRSRRHFRDH
jgi:hypothetical protein